MIYSLSMGLPFDGFVDLLNGLQRGVTGGVAGVDVLHLHTDLVVEVPGGELALSLEGHGPWSPNRCWPWRIPWRQTLTFMSLMTERS